MKPRQVPIFLYWRVENVQVWVNSIDWAVFWTFLDFTKLWTRWNFESIFLKIVHQKGLFDAIKENPNFSNCRRILEIYWQWLLIAEPTFATGRWLKWLVPSCNMTISGLNNSTAEISNWTVLRGTVLPLTSCHLALCLQKYAR